jgi:hypothetical protein
MEIFQLEDEVHYEKLNQFYYKLPRKFSDKNICKLVPLGFSIEPISRYIPSRQSRCQYFELTCDSCAKPLTRFQEGQYETEIHVPEDSNLWLDCNIPADRILKFAITPKIKYNMCRVFKVKINLMALSVNLNGPM